MCGQFHLHPSQWRLHDDRQQVSSTVPDQAQRSRHVLASESHCRMLAAVVVALRRLTYCR